MAPDDSTPPIPKEIIMRLLDQLITERSELSETVDGILTRAADEARDLSETEDSNLADLKARADVLDSRIAELRDMQVANLAAAKVRAEVSADDTTERAAAGVVTVNDEPMTYAAEHRGRSFFSDVYNASTYGDADARDRLNRHRDEMDVEHRDGTTGNFSGLVVPQYLTQLAAELARAGRPFADQCTGLPLPDDGMTINISRVTTGASAAVQAAENDAVSETDVDDTLMTVDVRTVASGQQLSRQAIERGTGVDQLIAADMLGALATVLDNQCLNGSGSSGQMLGLANVAGVNAVTYDDASPTAAEAFSKLVDGIQQVNSNRYAGADLIVMHPRRLAWFQASTDSSGRPLVVPQQNVPSNAMGVGPVAGYGVTGASIAGLPVVTDANVVTDAGAGTEDEIYIVRRADMLLFEDNGPALVRMDQTAGLNLTVTMVAYTYAAAAFGRYPASISKISGTGLIAPTF
jgi:HK97 family phage major capsid protein